MCFVRCWGGIVLIDFLGCLHTHQVLMRVGPLRSRHHCPEVEDWCQGAGCVVLGLHGRILPACLDLEKFLLACSVLELRNSIVVRKAVGARMTIRSAALQTQRQPTPGFR